MPTHLHSTPPLRGFPSEYCYAVWHGKKTRMVWLPIWKKNLMICLLVLTQLTNVTDTRTHTHTDTALTTVTQSWLACLTLRLSHFKEYRMQLFSLSPQPVADPVCVRPTLPNMSNAVQGLSLGSRGSVSLAQLLGIGYHLTCSAVQTDGFKKKLKTFLFQLAFN